MTSELYIAILHEYLYLVIHILHCFLFEFLLFCSYVLCALACACEEFVRLMENFLSLIFESGQKSAVNLRLVHHMRL